VDALITATSVGAGATTPVLDSVWAQIGSILSAKVDLTNTPGGNLTSTDGGSSTAVCVAGSNCDLDLGPTANPTFAAPGSSTTPAAFPLYLKNQEATNNSYNLTASVPPGWTVKFVPGNGTCASAAVPQPVAVGSGAQGGVLACLTPPVGTVPGTTPVTFSTTKSGEPAVGDTLTDAVLVTLPVVPVMQLGPATGTGTTPNGGTTVTPVTLTNTGTASCGLNGGFNVSVAVDAAARAAGWAATVYYDSNKTGVIASNDPVIDTSVASTVANLTAAIAGSLVPLAAAPGNTQGLPLLVNIFAPASATVGSTATATLVVTDLNANPTAAAPACPATTGRYAVTVTNGQLTVQKSHLKVVGVGTAPAIACDGTVVTGFGVLSQSGRPGDCIVYRIVATNNGSAPVTNVVLNDAVPPFTLYNATQPAQQCAATGNIGTAAMATVGSGAATTTLSCAAAGANGLTLNPLGTLTLIFAVQVQQ
jgi:uncharacterized repeat protein (TIGR01451 family)